MKHFHHCRSEEEARAEYRRLAALHHPDKGGNVDTFREVEEEFREFQIVMKHLPNFQKQGIETPCENTQKIGIKPASASSPTLGELLGMAVSAVNAGTQFLEMWDKIGKKEKKGKKKERKQNA